MQQSNKNLIGNRTSSSDILNFGQPLTVAVIGGGPIGALVALNCAAKGYTVHLYERREDIRTAELVEGRSINLALSQRGRKALSEVGLEQIVLSTAIPMRGRMLHDVKGSTSVVLYDPVTNQSLYSIGRKYLNEILLTAGEKCPNIFYHFDHKLTSINLNENSMEFKVPRKSSITKAVADVILGCDGAYSAVRRHLMKTPGFNYSQEYIEHGYLELCIPPSQDGDFQMPKNYLHIWPRDTFMMIALPNQDKSFTVTLSMPFKVFETIKTETDLVFFFKKYYVDALPLIGEKQLIKDFFKSKPQHLISVKCNPYNYGSKVLLLGDAAHAMVPYYGQGMNAGMEDCSLLMSILNQSDLGEALEHFTSLRWKDAETICDLAMYNYVEMRDLTKRLSFRCRKWMDTILYRYFPTFWIPLYNSVSFSSIPYSKCIENKKWQDKMLRNSFIAFVTICITLTIILIL